MSQWRKYSGWQGVVSIGFKTALYRLAEKEEGRLASCVYDREKQNKLISELVGNLLAEIIPQDKSDALADTNLVESFREKLLEIGAFFKDSGFSEEREWRIVTGVKLN